jgi:hypothetical protein
MSDKVVIDVWSGGGTRGNEPYVATDRHGRLRLSSATVSMLSARGVGIKLYVGYDKANRRIALGKPDVVKPTDAQPLSFDKSRHYANISAFMKRHQLPFESVKYVYDGKYEGWLMFKQAGYTAPDGRGSE